MSEIKFKVAAAAAMLALSGSAFAQTNVQLYGLLDTGIVYGKWNPSAKGLVVSNDTLTATRLGIQGAEDLGGGLKANFNLEMGFAGDTGAAGAPFWNRGARVGLSGGFGEVRIGRLRAPNFWILLGQDPSGVGIAAMSAPDVLMTNDAFGGLAGLTGFYDNSVSYRLPNMSGVTGEIMFSAGNSAGSGNEGMTDATKKQGRMIGANLQYSAGPLWLGLGYQDMNSTTVNDQSQKTTVFGAKYTMGNVTLAGGYAHASRNVTGMQNKTDTWQLQTKIKVGAAGELDLGIAALKEPNSRKASAFHIGYAHNLSKRTSVYAYAGRLNNNANTSYSYPARLRAGGNAATAGYDPQAVLVGIRHAF